MTSGLGDYLIMGDLIRKVESLSDSIKCLIVHKNNPHINLWPYDNPEERFFNIYNLFQFVKMLLKLKKYKTEGYTTFGLQMAPGSVQGYLLHKFLKNLKVLDFIVDFNLINADIITPRKGDYILDIHLNQVKDLLKINVPEDFYILNLPVNYEFLKKETSNSNNFYIGLHPWSRRGHLSCFVWPYNKWIKLLDFLLSVDSNIITIFGKDKGFKVFKELINQKFQNNLNRIRFNYTYSVLDLIREIQYFDLIISVNTSVVHIGYALKKKMIVLSGPSLDLWNPKDNNIKIVKDKSAFFKGTDKYIKDSRFENVKNIATEEVINLIKDMRDERNNYF